MSEDFNLSSPEGIKQLKEIYVEADFKNVPLAVSLPLEDQFEDMQRFEDMLGLQTTEYIILDGARLQPTAFNSHIFQEVCKTRERLVFWNIDAMPPETFEALKKWWEAAHTDPEAPKNKLILVGNEKIAEAPVSDALTKNFASEVYYEKRAVRDTQRNLEAEERAEQDRLRLEALLAQHPEVSEGGPTNAMSSDDLRPKGESASGIEC